MDNLESFYHGLVVSKIWLCEKLEEIVDKKFQHKPKIVVLGGWHNLISFMLLVRRPDGYEYVVSYDKDPEAKLVADRICNAWTIENPNVTNITQDILSLDFSQESKNTIFINCSVDQISTKKWYDTIPYGNLVCLQTTDIIDEFPRWEINHKTKNIEEFKLFFPMTEVLFEGKKEIKYSEFSYNRLMLIGIK